MALSLDKIKRDFARNKKRSFALAALGVVLVGFVVKAYFEMSPRTVAADAGTTAATDATGDAPMSAAETDARIKQSQELWKALKEVHGMPASAAFTFVPGFYNPDPSRQRVGLPTVEPTAQVTPVNMLERNRQIREAEIRAAGQKLIVNSTVVGSGNSRPVAVVNGRILGVGDRVNGFEIIAIKAREVVFKLDGVTIAVPMAGSVVPTDEHHGQ